MESVRVLRTAVWFGILAAGVELAILGFRMYVLDRAPFGMDSQLSLVADHRVFWLVPVAEVATFLVPAVLLAIAALVAPSVHIRFVSVALSATLAVWTALLNFLWLHWLAGLMLSVGAGLTCARYTRARWGGFDRLVSKSLGWLVAAVVTASTGVAYWHGAPERSMLAHDPAPAGAPNVILLILDTVRAFNIGAYGYDRPTTPNIDALAQRGVLFEQAYASAPWTLPSHASMFTGRLPHEMSADMTAPLDDEWPTIAEEMQKRGYLTAGFVANLNYCLWVSGLGRGFGHYEDFHVSPILIAHHSAIFRVAGPQRMLVRLIGEPRLIFKDADQVNREFLNWQSTTKGRPYFAFLNYFDAHRPYLPPPPYDRKFSASRAERFRVTRRGAKANLPPEAKTVLVNAYDEALVYLDDRIGRLVREIESRDSLRKTIIIITSDHGEQFGEHGLFYHANSLYAQLLRVPLLVVNGDRAAAGRRIPVPVSLRDLAPTVLDLSGSGTTGPFPGNTLSRYWSSDTAARLDAPPIAAELSPKAQLIADFAPKWRGMRSVIVDGRHYIVNGRNSRTGKTAEELYDIASDSLEERNLIGVDSLGALVGRLRNTLDSLLPPDKGPKDP